MMCAAKSRGGIAILAMALIMVISIPSFAFREVETLQALNIQLPADRGVPVFETLRAAESPFASAAAFEARVGSHWNYWWNEATGTPTQVWGPAYETGSGLITTADRAETVAREFIAQNAGLFGTDGHNLVLRSASNALGGWGLVFDQMHGDIPVVGGRAHLVMTESGRIFNFGSDVYRGIEISTTPALSTDQALDAAKSSISFVAGRDKVLDHNRMVIIPDPTAGIVTYHLAYENRVDVADPFGKWTSTVDANTGDVIGRWNEIHFFDGGGCYNGTSEGDAEDWGYCDGITPGAPLTNHRVTVTGLGTVFSDPITGAFDFGCPGDQGPLNISAGLDGRWINSNNMGGSDAVFNGMISADTPFPLLFNDGNARRDERDVFFHGNRIHDILKAIDPAATQADYEMPGNVNHSQTCNAYWDGTSINFFREGGGCGNTGQMGDVIYHEYAHGIVQWLHGGNTCDMGESGADTWAMMITDFDPIMGEGFYLNNCSNGIRTCDNNMQYPQSGCYQRAELMCGFWWDAGQQILVSEGWTIDQLQDFLIPVFHYSRKNTLPQGLPAQVLAAFVTDDLPENGGDGNLENGTPHFDAFCFAAEEHGFECPEVIPGVSIAHTPLDCTTDESARDIEATIYSNTAAIDPDKVHLYYSIDNGAFVEVDMTDQGSDLWAAQIPGQTQPTQVSYYIEAEDMAGNVRTSPENAPTETHDYSVALLYDPFEAESGWTVNAEGDDDAITGEWERVDPVGTIAQPEDDTTINGTDCWVTGQHTAGPPSLNDVDGGKTTLFSPVYDLSEATSAKALYDYWFSNDQGIRPGLGRWVVEARNNGGAWTEVENTVQSNNAWEPSEIDLIALFGGAIGDVEIRFFAEDFDGESLVEAAIDDFKLLVEQGSADVDEDIVSRLVYSLGEASPNPFNPQTTIRFSVPETVEASIKVYSVDGREVRNLLEKSVEPGTHNVVWDSRDNAGRSVSAGVYYYVLDAGSFQATRQMVVMK